VRVPRAVPGEPGLDPLPADVAAVDHAGADPPATAALAGQGADDGPVLDQRLHESPRLRPGRLILRLTRMRHLWRDHAFEADVHTPDHDGIAVDCCHLKSFHLR
jgi:hypothetical protein